MARFDARAGYSRIRARHPRRQRIQEQWDAAFDEFTAEVEEYIDAGDFVVTVTHWRGKGKSSDLGVDLRTADVVEFKEGKIVRVTIGYPDKDAALKAVRLRESAVRPSA